MITHILADIIWQEFEKVVGRDQQKTGRAMHLGFHMRPNKDQYCATHMYIFAPSDYTYVVTQKERVDTMGVRIVDKMELLIYHRTAWRESIRHFVSTNQDQLTVLSAFGTLHWYDVMVLTAEEQKYLQDLTRWSYDPNFRGDRDTSNPFDVRGFWNTWHMNQQR